MKKRHMIKLITASLLFSRFLGYKITYTVNSRQYYMNCGNKQIQQENRKATRSTWINYTCINAMLYSQCISEPTHLRDRHLYSYISIYLYRISAMFKFWKLQLKYNKLFYSYDTPSDICNDLNRLRNIQILK